MPAPYRRQAWKTAVLFPAAGARPAAIGSVYGSMLSEYETRSCSSFLVSRAGDPAAVREGLILCQQAVRRGYLQDTAIEGYRHAIIHRGQLQCDPRPSTG